MVKNSRRCRPRARWKIEAPCMIVLSTSKNAAAGRVGRRRQRALHLGGARRTASPASAERLRRSRRGVASRGRRSGASLRRHSRNPSGPERRRRAVRDSRAVSAHLAELLSSAAAEAPDRVALVEARVRPPGPPGPSWTPRSTGVARGLDALGPGRRLPRRDRAGQPHRVRHQLPRRAARRPGRRAGQPALGHRRAGPAGRRLRRPAWWSPTPPR